MAKLTVATLPHNHRLYLQVSNAPGVALITTKLTGPENYGLWSKSSSSSMGKVQCCCTFMDQVYHIWTEVSSLKQGSDNVTTYYSKLRYLWDELDVLVPASLCTCAEAKTYIEHLNQQRFLMGLNESYSHIRSDLLLKITVPSVNQAYATTVQEESQRLLSVVEIHKEPLTMLANRKPGFRGKKLLDNPCVHCGYRNHLSKDCYRIIGYPTDFKSKRNPDASSSSRSTGGFQ
ncbi:hypothetical protein R3W88_004727 [Solanum pinnatisectum]|uniref:Retrotransposon gag domain-containing protein n=1 Tax=Solanum pinnatisectum TaxID=50273 RepID=A0AAV9KA90_9SOLN|nr:hypothetical protein R3W88_004727 [Solanum pinnatisectum]